MDAGAHSDASSVTEACAPPSTWASASEECLFCIDLGSEVDQKALYRCAESSPQAEQKGCTLVPSHAIIGNCEGLLKRPEYKLWQS